MTALLATVVGTSVLLSGCAANKPAGDNSSKTSSGPVTIDFWSAPVPQQQAFWKKMADEYAKVNTNVKVNVSAMPESPSSEAGIQSAIAGGTAPTISENVFRGFGAQLAENSAIVPLDSFQGFNDIVKTRGMENIMNTWKYGDGHQYVLPVFSNPSLFLWRIDILKELGYNEPPKTYSQVIELGKKLKAKYPDKFVWASADFVNTSWYKRWWDYLTLYHGASNGNAFVKGNQLVAEDKAATDVFKFFADMTAGNMLLSQKSTDPFETGLSVATQLVPFKFKAMREKYPDLKFNQKFVVAAAPVPDGVDTNNVKTIADSKGLVIYSQASKEKQQAAFDFVKWVYSKPENDLAWLETTNLLPARDNLTNEPAFKDVLAKYPELNLYAASVKNAVPAIDSSKYVDIQTAIGEKGLVPVLSGKAAPDKAWESVKEAIKNALK